MPDITMCQPEECSLKHLCYRYTAIPDKYQSYADFSDGNKEECFMTMSELKLAKIS